MNATENVIKRTGSGLARKVWFRRPRRPKLPVQVCAQLPADFHLGPSDLPEWCGKEALPQAAVP